MSSPRVSLVPLAPPFTPVMLPSTPSPSSTSSRGTTPTAFALNAPFTPSRTSVSPSLAFRGFTSPYPSLAAPYSHTHNSSLFDSDVGTLAPPPNIDAIAGARVHALASNYMLLEYAAQLKGLTEHGIIRTGRTLRHIPREIGEAVRYVRKEAARIILAIQTEIQDITSGKRAERANLERIKNAHNHLQAATELLNSAEVQTVAMAKKRRQSAHLRPPPPTTDAAATDAPLQITQSEEEKKLAVNSLASVMANLSATAALPPLPAPVPSPSSTAAPSPSSLSSPHTESSTSSNTAEAEVAAAKHLTALQEQIQLLKQQMETMAKLQQLMPQAAAAVASGNVSAGVSAVGPAIPLAPTLHSRNNSVAAAQPKSVAAPIPQAPTLLPTSFFFTGMEAVQEEENISVVSSDASVPMAPPPPCAFTAPSTSAPAAPVAPATPSSSTSSSSSHTSQSITTPFAKAGILGEITNRAQLRATAAAPKTPAASLSSPTKRPATTPRSASVIVPSSADKKALSVNVYTRRIPGSESMSLQDSIKVASRIKLRKTDQERSPGGTPCKDKRKAYTTNSTQDVLQAALAARFKNIHALDAAKVRSQSLCLPRTPAGVTSLVEDSKPRQTPSHARRDSVDKENWETS